MFRAIFALISYKIDPIKTGTVALNTWVNKTPGRNVGVPLPVLHEIAKLAHETVVKVERMHAAMRKQKMPGTMELLAKYTQQLEYYAFGVKEILSQTIDAEAAKIRYPDLYRILYEYPWAPGESAR